MSPWSTSRATPSPGSSPCPSRRPSTAPSITGSGGGSRRCSPTSRPGASGWRTASSVTRSGSRACSWSWRWPCTGRCPPACGRPRVSPCRPKKSPGATGAEGGPRPNLPLQAWPAPHPTPPAAPRPAPTPLGRLAELMDGKGPDVWTLDKVAALIEEVRAVNPALRAWAFLNRADPIGRDNEDAARIIAETPGIELIDARVGNRKAFPAAHTQGLAVTEMVPSDPKANGELDQLYSYCFSTKSVRS